MMCCFGFCASATEVKTTEESGNKEKGGDIELTQTPSAKTESKRKPPTQPPHVNRDDFLPDLLEGVLGQSFSYVEEVNESHLKAAIAAEKEIHIGVHCDACDVCPIQGPVFVYDNSTLTTLCQKCTSGSQVPRNSKETKCVTLADTLSCLLTNSGLLSNQKQLSEQNFIAFWKIKYPEMPDYQVNALVASIHIEQGIQDIHSDSFIDSWLSLSSEESNIVEQVTHRQLECHCHEQCRQPFGATPILGYAYVSLDKAGMLKCYCEQCFRAQELTTGPSNRYEKCRTEQQSMSAAFRQCAAKSKKSAAEWVQKMGKMTQQRGPMKLPVESFAALHGYTEKMSSEELANFCDHMHVRPGTQVLNFYQFAMGSLVLAGNSHETPTLDYSDVEEEGIVVENGVVVEPAHVDVQVEKSGELSELEEPGEQETTVDVEEAVVEEVKTGKQKLKEDKKQQKKEAKKREKKLAKVRARMIEH